MRTINNTTSQDWSPGSDCLPQAALMLHWRRFTTWSVLTVYLGCMLFGEQVHLLQCNASHTGSAAVSGCHSCGCHEHAHRRPSSSTPPVSVSSDLRSADHSPSHEEPAPGHDSRNCTVCQVLAIAQDPATLPFAVVSFDILPEALIPIRESAVPILIGGCQSRGPPLV